MNGLITVIGIIVIIIVRIRKPIIKCMNKGISMNE